MKAVKRLLKRLRSKPHAEHVIAPHMVWKDQPFFLSAKARHTMRGIPDIRCYVLQSCLRSIDDVEGDVAECGVREGKSASFMREACDRQRTFYLFDSFEGLSDPVAGRDTLSSSWRKDGTKRVFAVDAERVMSRLEAEHDFKVMRGWIPERFPEVGDRVFAMVHIDVDLYEPTRDAIAFFYPRVSQHGIIVCDDYGSGNYPGARAAIDEYLADKPEKPIELPQGQCLIVKR